MSVKIVNLSRGKEFGQSTIDATFLVNTQITPLKVNQETKPEVYAKIEKILNAENVNLNEAATELFNLMSPQAKVQEQIKSSFFLSKNLSLRNGKIYFGEERLEDTLATHMLSMLDSENTPKDEKLWSSYVKFLDNMYQNVNPTIREQLFRWMDYENKSGSAFAITEDGCIVGYKGCGGTILEPMSKFKGYAIVDGKEYNGHIPNKVGSVVQMPRSAVTHDPAVGCSQGLHVGTRNYATSWAPILLLVKVNPRDVVSVPFECESQKMRVCEYTVLEVTDASDEHRMFYNSSSDEENETSGSELTQSKAKDLVGKFVYIETEHDYEGTVIDTDSEFVYLHILEEDETVTIAIDDICNWEILDNGEDEEDDIDFLTEDEGAMIEEMESLEEDGTEVTFIYGGGKEFTGIISSVYVAPGKEPGVIVSNEETGEVKHLKFHRIEAWSIKGTDNSDEVLEFLSAMEDAMVSDYTVTITYDGNKEFTGLVSDTYDVAGREGVIIRNDETDQVKHIKVNRIDNWSINDVCDAGDEDTPLCDMCSEEGTCLVENSQYAYLLEHEEGTQLVITHQKHDGVISATSGTLVKTDICELEIVLMTRKGKEKTIAFADILSVQSF